MSIEAAGRETVATTADAPRFSTTTHIATLSSRHPVLSPGGVVENAACTVTSNLLGETSSDDNIIVQQHLWWSAGLFTLDSDSTYGLQRVRWLAKNGGSERRTRTDFHGVHALTACDCKQSLSVPGKSKWPGFAYVLAASCPRDSCEDVRRGRNPRHIVTERPVATRRLCAAEMQELSQKSFWKPGVERACALTKTSLLSRPSPVSTSNLSETSLESSSGEDPW